MSISASKSSSDEKSNQKVIKSKSSNNDNSFKNEVTIESDMEPLKKCNLLLTMEELTSPDYDAWIVAIPGMLDAHKIKKLEFSLSEKNKFKIEDKRYRALIEPSATTNTFLLPDENGVIKTVARETMGMISFVKDLNLKGSKSKKTLVTNLPAKLGVDPPTGLKRRHPLYGDELEDILAKARQEKRPKPAQKKGLKKLNQEIIEDNQPVKEKKKNKLKN